MYIVTSLPGTGGDIVSAVIDNIDMYVSSEGTFLNFGEGRDLLTGNLPTDGSDILDMIDASPYLVLESKFHKSKIEPNNRTKKYSYISIDVRSEKECNWVHNRLSTIWPSHEVSISNMKNFSIINHYYADYVIKLEDILEGRLIDKLKEFIDTPLDTDLYDTWCQLVLSEFPFD
jgi:hypothetical protein